jgi:hypothetical protein
MKQFPCCGRTNIGRQRLHGDLAPGIYAILPKAHKNFPFSNGDLKMREQKIKMQ